MSPWNHSWLHFRSLQHFIFGAMIYEVGIVRFLIYFYPWNKYMIYSIKRPIECIIVVRWKKKNLIHPSNNIFVNVSKLNIIKCIQYEANHYNLGYKAIEGESSHLSKLVAFIPSHKLILMSSKALINVWLLNIICYILLSLFSRDINLIAIHLNYDIRDVVKA